MLPFTKAEWEKLGSVLSRRGLRLLATGHPKDPWPESLQGTAWERYDADLVNVYGTLHRSKFSLGFDSGIVWAHAFLRPDETTVLIDENHFPHMKYDQQWSERPFGPKFTILKIEDSDLFERTLAAAEAL